MNLRKLTEKFNELDNGTVIETDVNSIKAMLEAMNRAAGLIRQMQGIALMPDQVRVDLSTHAYLFLKKYGWEE